LQYKFWIKKKSRRAGGHLPLLPPCRKYGALALEGTISNTTEVNSYDERISRAHKTIENLTFVSTRKINDTSIESTCRVRTRKKCEVYACLLRTYSVWRVIADYGFILLYGSIFGTVIFIRFNRAF